MPRDLLKYPGWAKYRAAMLELDNVRLIQKADEAERAILLRLRSMDEQQDGEDLEEREALQDAITGLRILRESRF